MRTSDTRVLSNVSNALSIDYGTVSDVSVGRVIIPL